MILKLNKNLNTKNEFSLVSFNMDNSLDNISLDNFSESNCNIYETNEYYYYYIDKIIDIDNCEIFKIKVKKGDIVSLTARDNSYIVFPSKKSFSFAFNLNYNRVLSGEYLEVLRDGKPYEVKYVKDKDDKINDGVVYTLSQLVSYISDLIKGYNYRKAQELFDNDSDPIKRVIIKYYSSKKQEFHKKYELNIKKCGLNKDNKFVSFTKYNVSKSNHYLYDYYLLRMFAYMILTKSKLDRERSNEEKYCFNEEFNTIEEVYSFLENNQDIVNQFFIETELLFKSPNDMITMYAPHIDGIYMYYEYNGVKTWLYRSIDKQYLDNKSLKPTYVSKHYKHKIKGIKNNYSI